MNLSGITHSLLTLTTLFEIITGISALMLQVAYLHFYRKMRVRTAGIVALLTIPVLFISLESMNSILTCDESYIVYEPVDLANSSLLVWRMGGFRTTDLLVGIPIAGIKAFTGFSMDILAVFGKSLHWLLSFVLILMIIELLCRFSEKRKMFPLLYLVAVYSISAFPVVLLAQKIINYDAFSMLFSVAAMLLLAVGWKEKLPVYLYVSVVFAAFAAQEKLIASPLVWTCLVVVPLRIAFQQGHTAWSISLRRVWRETFFAALAALSVFIVSFLLVSIVNTQGAPGKNADNVFYPLITGFWPVLRTIGIDVDKLLDKYLFERWYFIPLFAAIIAVVLSVVTTAGAAVCNLVYSRKTLIPTGNRISMNLRIVNYMLLFCLVALGIAGTYLIDAFLAPQYPVAPGDYHGYTFNRSFVYFGAASLPVHLAFSAGWAYVTFSNALPTAFLLLAVMNVIAVIRKKSTPTLIFEAMFTGALLIPLLYGMLQIPCGNRYLNIFLLIVNIKLLYDFFDTMNDGVQPKIIAIVLVVFLMAEVYPFRPLFGSFRPVWSNYPVAYNTTPSKAVLNPWWMGWGEEVFMAGKQLEKYYKKDNPLLAGITLYHNYLGEWLYKENNLRLVQLDSTSAPSYTKNDFYLLNRMGITSSRLNFPDGVKPFGTISFRGFIQGWVFRGSDLDAAGFRFKETHFEYEKKSGSSRIPTTGNDSLFIAGAGR